MVVESRLSVRFEQEHVAELAHDRGRSSLQYLAGAERAVSRRLPVRSESYAHEACHSFFANLLPEAGFRDGLCRRLALPVEDDFALLSLLGQDCAGAVTLLRPIQRDSEPPSYAVGALTVAGWRPAPPPPLKLPAMIMIASISISNARAIRTTPIQGTMLKPALPAK